MTEETIFIHVNRAKPCDKDLDHKQGKTNLCSCLNWERLKKKVSPANID